jgi:F0F1-type ATP synthase assembly protein I
MRSSGTGPDPKQISGVYQGSVEAVLALLIAMGVGYWLDERYDTEPWLLMTGVVLGFAAMVMRIWRMRVLVEDPPEEQ